MLFFCLIKLIKLIKSSIVYILIIGICDNFSILLAPPNNFKSKYISENPVVEFEVKYQVYKTITKEDYKKGYKFHIEKFNKFWTVFSNKEPIIVKAKANFFINKTGQYILKHKANNKENEVFTKIAKVMCSNDDFKGSD
jgi:hypothetical protein